MGTFETLVEKHGLKENHEITLQKANSVVHSNHRISPQKKSLAGFIITTNITGQSQFLHSFIYEFNSTLKYYSSSQRSKSANRSEDGAPPRLGRLAYDDVLNDLSTAGSVFSAQQIQQQQQQQQRRSSSCSSSSASRTSRTSRTCRTRRTCRACSLPSSACARLSRPLAPPLRTRTTPT